MSKKKPRSKDPHSWIKDTTKKGEEPEPADQAAKIKPAQKLEAPEAADETSSGPGEEMAAREPIRQRAVIVEYDKKDGQILATHEVIGDAQQSAGEASAGVSAGNAAARIALSGELLDKSLIDIHENYKVVISNTNPTLAPKD
jgi:hypothetical protein